MAFPPNQTAAPRPPMTARPAAPQPMAAPPAPPPMPPQPGPGEMAQGGGSIDERMAQLSADDIAALQDAPDAVDVIKRLLPEIADMLDAALDQGQGEGMDEVDQNRGPDEPNYSLPRPATRLGQM